jgi:UPF0755 protein
MLRHIAANALTLIVVALLALLAVIGWGQQQFRTAGPLAESQVFEVNRGEGLNSIADRLAADGRDPQRHDLPHRGALHGSRRGLRFGEYEIPAGASMEEILRIFNSGVGIPRRVIVPEGLTSWQVVELLRAREDLAGEIAEVPAEGTLAPAAYDYTRDTERSVLIERMTAQQQAWLAEAWAARAPDLPVETPEELLILASIIEKETGVRRNGGRSPRSSSTGCGGACGCRPTRR